MKWNFLIALLILKISVQAQTKCDCFDRLYNLSNHYYFREEWPNAIEALKDAISFLDSNQKSRYYFELGEYYERLNNTDSSTQYFARAIEGGYPVRFVEEKYPSAMAKMDSAHLEKTMLGYWKKIDWNLYEKYLQIFALDQSVRDGTLFSRNDIFTGSPQKKAFIDTLSRRVDSISAEYVISFLERYGYPSEYKLGFYPSGFMALLLHLTATDGIQSKRLLTLLENLNESCNLPTKSLILFLRDRQKLYKDNTSCCGLLGGSLRYSSIEEPNIADSIRLKNNQLRLKEELFINDPASRKSYQGLLKRGYKPKPYPNNYFCLTKYQFE